MFSSIICQPEIQVFLTFLRTLPIVCVPYPLTVAQSRAIASILAFVVLVQVGPGEGLSPDQQGQAVQFGIPSVDGKRHRVPVEGGFWQWLSLTELPSHYLSCLKLWYGADFIRGTGFDTTDADNKAYGPGWLEHLY